MNNLSPPRTLVGAAAVRSTPMTVREDNVPVIPPDDFELAASGAARSKCTVYDAREIAHMLPNGPRATEEFKLDRFEVGAPRDYRAFQLKARRDIVGDPA